MADFDISVIVPNYNYGRFLATTLNSIRAQTLKPREIIVVDDGSNDMSVNLVRDQFPEIKLVAQENKGVNAARNHGIKLAKGKFIALCDSDDLWLPEKLEKQIQLFAKPKTILVGSHIKEFGENARGSTEYAKFRGDLSQKYKRFPGTAWIPGTCSSSLFLRSVALDIGLFDENLRGSAEDWEFFARLAIQGDFDFVDEVLVKIRKHGSARSKISTRVWYRDNRKALRQFSARSPNFRFHEKFLASLYLVRVFVKAIVRNVIS